MIIYNLVIPFTIWNQSTELKIIILYMPKWVSHNQGHWQGYLPESEGLGGDMFLTFFPFWSNPHFSAVFFHPQSRSSVWSFFHHSLLCLSSIFKGPFSFVCVLVGQSCLILQPHGLQPAKLLCPWKILKARILERVAIPFSRGCFPSRNQSQVSCIAGRFFTVWTTREAQLIQDNLF